MSKQILVVDDERETLLVLRAILENADYEVLTAGNGQLALDNVATNKPDLILLDQKMPKMDGSEVLRHLKASKETRDIPVVMLSAKDEPSDLKRGWDSGTDLYLIKPVVGTELTDYISCILDE